MRAPLAWLAIAGLTCACGDGDGSASAPTGAPATSAAPPASAPAAAFGPLWERARASSDPLDVAELGRAEGGHGLIRGLDDERYAATARAALPGVPDGIVALPVLAARMRRGATSALADGETLLAILGAPTVIGERLDPEGETTAVNDLLALASDDAAPRDVRAIAISALRRLEARGLVKEAQIPTALDKP